MSYQVLARKWRPRQFDEVVGQEHVVRALTHALDHDRLHHAYLFSGTRGVGKTTIARILAKCLNCEVGVSATPCGACNACTAIEEGRFVDLLEVDAASRTKVDETRELLDNVQYAPTRARYKIYLIDEVHMLSRHSFNALLKTLEEPPPHVKFLLATTDPQRVPVTVLSRCLQFNLKRLPAAEIAAQLGKIVAQEKIEAEPAALERLARAADGSVRDALSLLDQAISYGGGKLKDGDCRAMLGTIEKDRVSGLIDSLAQNDGAALLDHVDAINAGGADCALALEDLLRALHRIGMVQALPGLGDEEEAEINRLAKALTPEEVQLYYQIGLTGRRDLSLAPDPRIGLEMTLLRMLAFRPAMNGEPTVGAPSPAQPRQTPSAPAPSNPRAGSSNGAARAKTKQQATGMAIENWHATLHALTLTGAARELAAHCAWETRQGHRIKLKLLQADAYLNTDAPFKRLEAALQQHLDAPVRLVIELTEAELDTPASRRKRRASARQREAERSIEQDPTFIALQETMGAQVLPGSVRPSDD